MTFKDYSQNSRVLIENNLKRYFSQKKSENIPDILKKQNAIEILEEFVLKGKLIRGTLFLFALEMMGERVTDEHIDIACAIELVHSALLIQDDIIDNDLTRRNGQTIHAKYQSIGEEIGANDTYHYGLSVAIVVADVAIFNAVTLLSHYKNSAINKLLEFYSQEIYLVALAEGIDSEFGQTQAEPTKEEIYSVYKYKTARYTFSLPFIMAGIICQKEEPFINILGEMGELAGLIFQLKDDEIGLLSDEATIGKPVGSDIRENKKTIFRVLLYEHSNETEKKLLNQSFGNKNISEAQIDEIKHLISKYKLQETINQEIGGIMEKVRHLSDSLVIADKYRIILNDLLEFNIKRSL